MTSEITIEEAQAKLQQQRKEKVSVEAVTDIDGEVKTIFERMREKMRPTAEQEEREAKRKREDDARQIERIKREWNAPPRHLKRCTFENEEWKQVLEKIKGKLGSGFLIALVGANGPGKTQMGVEVMRHATEQMIQSSRYDTAIGVFMTVKTAYKRKSENSEDEMMEHFTTPFLLVIDEAGKRADTAWENNILFEIIDRRYRAMSDTLLISNQEEAEFCASIGPSITSRLNETGGLIETNWPSFR